MARRKGHSLYAALLACAGVPELEERAREILTPLVVRANARSKRVAAALGVCDRSARRLLALYGWTQAQPAAFAAKNARAAA